MRRPRSKLEVSTFPFLAVLLCTMGALLLLLFIMDRRAKVAARYRITEELQARQARTKAEEEARQAEWKKAKEHLHLTLLEQQNQLLAKSNQCKDNLSDASRKLAIVQTRGVDLGEKIKTETNKISTLQLEIDSQHVSLKQADKKETMTKAELLEAARELAELERAFQQLRTLKEREKQTYSVVPYRGKRGDTRVPIYVECDRDGVVFHPEKKRIESRDVASDSIRAEVERRRGPLVVQKAGKEQPKGPYVLFLIRPDGIETYYAARSSLKGYRLDFGYELVDAGWALDFPGGTLAKNSVPNRTSMPWKEENEPSPMPMHVAKGGGKEGTLSVPPSPIQSPSGIALGFSGSDKPSPATGNSARFSNGGNGNPGLPTPPIGFAGTGNGHAGVHTGIPVKPPTFIPIARNAPLVPIASSGGMSDGVVSGGSTTPSRQPTNLSGRGDPNSPGQAGNPSSGGNLDVRGQLKNLPGEPNPNTLANGAEQPANRNPPSQPAKGGNPAPTTGFAGQRTGSELPTADGDTLDSPALRNLPAFGADSGKGPIAAPPLSRLLGNKDFVINIDCHTDHVTVTPGGYTYRWTSSNLQETDQALTQTVTNLIARRQASVRPGEPAYRPLIRFQVSSDGLRSYYHVYPLLERLRVPMTRENVAESISSN